MIGYIIFHLFCFFYAVGANSYNIRVGGDSLSTLEMVWTVIFAPFVVACHIGMVMAKLGKK